LVLVDTSVLIAYFKGIENPSTSRFQYILDNAIPFGITPLIYQELLQGAKSEKEFALLKEYLDTQKIYSLKDERESYAAAARIFFDCKKKGITVRSTNDCLIAQTAIENGLFLLHNDSEFERMSMVCPLKIFRH
jgi:predicted nucleic acid-binding protein